MEQCPHLCPYNYYYPPNRPLFVNPSEFFMPDPFLRRSLPPLPVKVPDSSFSELKNKYDELLLKNEELKGKLENALTLLDRKQQPRHPRRKITRRKEDELEKKHRCCYDNCKKEYASVLALNFHMKAKHGGGTKKQRDDLAVGMCLYLEAAGAGRNSRGGYPQAFDKFALGLCLKFQEVAFLRALILDI
jgi:hypothetical protein